MEDSRDTNGMKNTITETLKKLSYKNISIDTTKGRSKIAKYKAGGRVKRAGGGPGLYANIAAKKARIKAGSGEKMRSPGSKGAPTAANFARAKQTAKS